MQTGLATIENMEVSKKFKVKLSYDSAVLLLDIYQKRKRKPELKKIYALQCLLQYYLQ